MTDQQAQALYRDHAEALEMNANGDSGLAAFLGDTVAEFHRPSENAPQLHPAAVDLDPLGRGEDSPAGDRLRQIAAIHALAGFYAIHPHVPAEDRLRQIAAIHALAEFYATHPDVPMPTSVVAVHTSSSYDGPEHDRVLAVMEFARTVGTFAQESWSMVSARHTVAIAHGMNVMVRMEALLSQRTDQ